MNSIGFAALGQTIIYNNRLLIKRKSRSLQLTVPVNKNLQHTIPVVDDKVLQAIRNKLRKIARKLLFRRIVLCSLCIGVTLLSLKLVLHLTF